MEQKSQEQDEAELLALARSGRSAAFVVLYTRYATKARHVATRLLNGDTYAAEDVVSSVSLSTWQALQRGKGPKDSFSAYFFTGIYNMCKAKKPGLSVESRGDLEEFLEITDYYKEHQSEDSSIKPFEHSVDSDMTSYNVFENELFHLAFRSLSIRSQQVLWEVIVEQRPQREVAERYALNPDSIRINISRMRKKLLQQYFVHYEQVANGISCKEAAKLFPLFTGVASRGLTPKQQKFLEVHLVECQVCSSAYRGKVAFENLSLHLPILLFGLTPLAGELLGSLVGYLNAPLGSSMINQNAQGAGNGSVVHGAAGGALMKPVLVSIAILIAGIGIFLFMRNENPKAVSEVATEEYVETTPESNIDSTTPIEAGELPAVSEIVDTVSTTSVVTTQATVTNPSSTLLETSTISVVPIRPETTQSSSASSDLATTILAPTSLFAGSQDIVRFSVMNNGPKIVESFEPVHIQISFSQLLQINTASFGEWDCTATNTNVYDCISKQRIGLGAENSLQLSFWVTAQSPSVGQDVDIAIHTVASGVVDEIFENNTTSILVPVS